MQFQLNFHQDVFIILSRKSLKIWKRKYEGIDKQFLKALEQREEHFPISYLYTIKIQSLNQCICLGLDQRRIESMQMYVHRNF